MRAPGRAASFARVLVLVLLAASPAPRRGGPRAGVRPAARGLGARGHGRALARTGGRPCPPLPGLRLLVGLHALVLFQLVPLPPALLRVVSPGSFAFYSNQLLLPPLVAWRPISVSPPDTLRGLAFLAAFSLLAVAVFRELGEGRWRLYLLRTVVYTGLALTVIALLQAVSSEPRRIYGVWQPRWDWAVFGPYVNRNHFAGYLVMAAALAVGFALEALARLRAAWATPPPRLPAARRGRGPGARARLGGRDGDRGRPRRLAVPRRRLGLRLRDAARCRLAAPRRRRHGARGAAARGPGRRVDRPRRRAAGLRGARHPRQPARPVARHAADGPALPGLRRGLERLRDRLPLVPDDLEDRVDRRGAQRLPAGAPRRRRSSASRSCAACSRSSCARRSRGPAARPSSSACWAPSWGWRSTSSSTSTDRSPRTPRPGSPSRRLALVPPARERGHPGLDGERRRP